MQLRSETHVRRRREPERGVLHQALLTHLETLLERTRAPDSGHGLPRFVERELRRYLECGLLAYGFARVHCSRCMRDELVAFACKGRGFCPSCCGRRMADTAAHLVDHVLPHAPVRQWVLSFPFRVRFLLASSPRMCAAVRGIFTRTLLGWLEQRALAAAAEGSARSHSGDSEPAARREPQFAARSGAVVFAQRFGSALNLNLHFHALVLDGAFVSPSGRLAPSFQSAAPLTDADVAELVEQLARRITRYLEREGRLPRAYAPADADEPAEHDAPLFDQLCAASIQGGAALAPESSRPIARLGQRRPPRPPPLPGSLCADRDGFSLHAKVLVPAGELERLEHLCRYVTRPPIATQRLVLAPDGRVIYGLKRHWRDGTSAASFDPLTFIERLAALVPPPRAHQLTYHGVLAPASAWRDLIVPKRAPASTSPSCSPLAPHSTTAPSTSARSRSSRSTWAELLRRVFALDVLTCPHCGGPRRLIAQLTDPVVVRKILAHLGHPTEPPRPAPARSREQFDFA